MDDRASELIEKLELKPHPEGGYFAETYRSVESVDFDALPSRYVSPRAHATAIYYLLTEEDISTMHRVASDEIFHFYDGDSVQMLWLLEDGSVQRPVLGREFSAGARPQLVVPRGTWQGCAVASGGSWALMGCTVAPGFEFADFEMGTREQLTKQFPDAREEIAALTGR